MDSDHKGIMLPTLFYSSYSSIKQLVYNSYFSIQSTISNALPVFLEIGISAWVSTNCYFSKPNNSFRILKSFIDKLHRYLTLTIPLLAIFSSQLTNNTPLNNKLKSYLKLIMNISISVMVIYIERFHTLHSISLKDKTIKECVNPG